MRHVLCRANRTCSDHQNHLPGLHCSGFYVEVENLSIPSDKGILYMYREI